METRLMRMETALETMTRAMDGLADTIVARVVQALDATERAPMVLTTRQLQAAVRAAMEAERGSGKRKRPADEGDGGEGEVRVEEVGLVTPPTVAKSQSPKTTEANATNRVESELVTPAPLSLIMLDDAIQCEAPVAPFTPVPPAKKPPQHKQPTQQPPLPAAAGVRRPFTAPPPLPPSAPTTIVRPTAKPVPMRPNVVTPPPPVPQQWPPRPAPPTIQATPATSGRLYLWGNAWHNLPEEYEFPRISVELMWRQWCCGDSEMGFLPLREIQTSDISTPNNRKRLSDLKFLMKFIEQRLQERGVWKESPSEIEADQMLNAVRGELFADSVTKNGMKRDTEGLKWHSAVTLLRSAHKKARTE